MQKLLLDVNIILDVAFDREPHTEASKKVLGLVEAKRAAGYLSAVSYPILHYFLKKDLGRHEAMNFLSEFLRLFRTAAVDEAVIADAMMREDGDFEDNIQIVCAEKIKADYIVTRNTVHFKKSEIQALTPAEYLVLA